MAAADKDRDNDRFLPACRVYVQACLRSRQDE